MTGSKAIYSTKGLSQIVPKETLPSGDWPAGGWPMEGRGCCPAIPEKVIPERYNRGKQVAVSGW